MKKVECIKSDNTLSLTVGKVYDVDMMVEDNCVYVNDDDDCHTKISLDYFKKSIPKTKAEQFEDELYAVLEKFGASIEYSCDGDTHGIYNECIEASLTDENGKEQTINLSHDSYIEF